MFLVGIYLYGPHFTKIGCILNVVEFWGGWFPPPYPFTWIPRFTKNLSANTRGLINIPWNFGLDWWKSSWAIALQTKKQTNKQTNKQTKNTNKQTNKQKTNKQTKNTNKQTNKHPYATENNMVSKSSFFNHKNPHATENNTVSKNSFSNRNK